MGTVWRPASGPAGAVDAGESTVLARAGLVVALLVALATTGCGADDSPPGAGPGVTTPSAAFLRDYVEPDGRVVRRDQDGDTVSEGQAYAMLVAVGSGDDASFRRVWGWTRQHLVRPDGTLSWRWADGAVVDASSAADADLDAARPSSWPGSGSATSTSWGTG